MSIDDIKNEIRQTMDEVAIHAGSALSGIDLALYMTTRTELTCTVDDMRLAIMELDEENGTS